MANRISTHKAAGELEANHAFRQEHDGQRAALFDAAKEVAGEAGISEETLKSIFDADSEYQMAKAFAIDWDISGDCSLAFF